METVEVTCATCGRTVFVQKDSVREKMFCTLGCMDIYERNRHMPFNTLGHTGY